MKQEDVVETRVRGLGDADLLAMLENQEGYTSEAIAIARDEVDRRGGTETVASRAEQALAEVEVRDRERQFADAATRIPRRAKILAWVFLLVSINGVITAAHTLGITPGLVSPLLNDGSRLAISVGILFGSPFCLACMIFILAFTATNSLLIQILSTPDVTVVEPLVYLGCAGLYASCWTRYLLIAAFRRGPVG